MIKIQRYLTLNMVFIRWFTFNSFQSFYSIMLTLAEFHSFCANIFYIFCHDVPGVTSASNIVAFATHIFCSSLYSLT